MGAKLKELFMLANARGGLAWTSQLAIKTCITTSTADKVEDSPALLMRVEQILEELSSQRKNSYRPPPRQKQEASQAVPTRLKKYFAFARERGGLPLAVKLAAKTCITTAQLDNLPDTEENVAKVRQALTQLLPSTKLPEF